MQVILESVALGFFRSGVEMRVSRCWLRSSATCTRTKRATSRMACSRSKRAFQSADDARRRLENLAYESVLRIAGRGGKPSLTTQWTALQTAGIDTATFIPKLLTEVSNPPASTSKASKSRSRARCCRTCCTSA